MEDVNVKYVNLPTTKRQRWVQYFQQRDNFQRFLFKYVGPDPSFLARENWEHLSKRDWEKFCFQLRRLTKGVFDIDMFEFNMKAAHMKREEQINSDSERRGINKAPLL